MPTSRTVYLTVPIMFSGRPGAPVHPLGAHVTGDSFVEVVVSGPGDVTPAQAEHYARKMANERFPAGWFTTYHPGPDFEEAAARFFPRLAHTIRLDLAEAEGTVTA